ncbi:O-antigen ligase family protein [Anabaena lutea]|uniref:O-antigen ligase family protein n=1 Tax=Anabaena lutea FACHB-196 TaxID=2692881 RepID=A0ABR8FAZ4_9NOST|nr:O-antigen ligase [Anabaena lutea]MBD2567388.1 O-antigen ligase family protein [Anabaena lutea FACHB-196]
MRKVIIFAEQGFTVAALIIYTGAILNLVLSGGAQQNEFVEYDSSLIRIINLLLYIVTSLLLVLRWKKTLFVLIKDRWIFPLLLFSAFSIFWSFDQATTLKNSVTLIGSSLFGLYLASRYTIKQQLNLLAWAFGIIILLSFIFAVALPSYGIMGGVHKGKWRGVFLHKNGLGAKMVMSSMFFLLLAYKSKKNKWLVWGGFSLSVLLMLLASSTSSLLNLLMLICAFFMFQTARLPYLLMLPTLTLIIAIGQVLYVWFVSNSEKVFASLGKDSTLTGRGDLWPFVFDMIWKHPWIGYGYGGFWQGWDGIGSAYIWRATGWSPTHPHNGFLALWLDVGLLGLGFFCLGCLQTFLKAIAWVRLTKDTAEMWPIMHITYMIIANLTETDLLNSNSIVWVLYVSASMSLSNNRITKPDIMVETSY